MLENPFYPYHPPMQSIMDEAVKNLAAAGHHIVDLSGTLSSLSPANDFSFKFFNMDPDLTSLKNIFKNGETSIPSLEVTYKLNGSTPEPTLRQLYDMNVDPAQVVAQTRQAFIESKLDFILGLGYQSCAVPHDTYGAPVYAVFLNCVDVNGRIYHNENSTIITKTCNILPVSYIPFSKASEAADVD